MARSRATEPAGYTNPDVRYERSDVETRGILVFGVGLGVGLVVIAAAMVWFGRELTRLERPRKITDLPLAMVDGDPALPDLHLESIDDLGPMPKGDKQKSKPKYVQLMPPRASAYLKPQRKDLAEGAPGVEPIQKAIDDLAGKLPVRAVTGTVPPLPSKAASGREVSGGGR